MNTEKSNDKVTSRVPKYLSPIISAITALLIGAYIITVFITLGRSVKRFVFHYCRAVYIVLCVTSVDVTVFTSVADFPATVPRIPCIVHNFKLR